MRKWENFKFTETLYCWRAFISWILPLIWSLLLTLSWFPCKETAEEKYGAVTFKAFYDFNNQKLQVEGGLLALILSFLSIYCHFKLSLLASCHQAKFPLRLGVNVFFRASTAISNQWESNKPIIPFPLVRYDIGYWSLPTHILQHSRTFTQFLSVNTFTVYSVLRTWWPFSPGRGGNTSQGTSGFSSSIRPGRLLISSFTKGLREALGHSW